MKICCKLLAILFKALLSYLKYFIDFQGLERTPMNIVSSCMEPAWTHCAYLDTPQRIVWLLRQNHPLGSPEKKAQTKHMQQQSQTLYTLQSGKKKKKNPSLESWSKMIVPFAPSLEITSPLRGIWQNALQLGILSKSHSQALFNWTALHAIKYFLS